VALVAKIQWDQKIMEKESEKKMAEIEGRVYTLWNFEQNLQFFVSPSMSLIGRAQKTQVK